MYDEKSYLFLSDIGFNKLTNNKTIKKNIKLLKKKINKNKIKINNNHNKHNHYYNHNIIICGDNYYDYYKKEDIFNIEKNMFSIYNINKNNILSILGNHDYYICPGELVKNNIFNIKDWYYTHDYGNGIKLFFIDTMLIKPDEPDILYTKICDSRKLPYSTIQEAFEHCTRLRKIMLDWLDNELNNSKNKFNIVIGHYPIYTLGIYLDINPTIMYYLYPILKKHNVQVYISGHEHNSQHIIINKEKKKDYKLHVFICGGAIETRDKLNKDLQLKDSKIIGLAYCNFMDNLILKMKYLINKYNPNDKKICFYFKNYTQNNKIVHKHEFILENFNPS